MNGIAIIILIVAQIFLVQGCSNGFDSQTLANYKIYYFSDYKGALKQLEKRYNISINYNVDDYFIDEQSKRPPSSGKATQIDDFELARFSRLLEEVLAQYPPDIVKNNIIEIRLSKTLSFFNVGYGGSNINSVIYLTSEGVGQGYTDFYIKQSFHHEFSSSLFNNYDFPKIQWLEANPADFYYHSDAANELKSIESDKDLFGEEQYYQNGIIAKYSYTNYENDFNLFAQMVFNEPERLKKLVNKYPILKKKYLIMKDFYLSISPSFTDTFNKIL